MSTRITRRGMLAGGVGLGALGFAAGRAGAQQKRDLVVAVQDIPPQLDPILVEYLSGYRILYNVYDTLIGTDYRKNFAVVPGLASSWKRIGDTALELSLREGVKFHDGTAMTAEDVAFSFGKVRMMDPGSRGHAATRAYLGTLAAVEAVDRYTVRVTTTGPDPVLEKRLAGWSAQVISKAGFERAKDWDSWARNPVATGPFTLAKVKTGESIRIEAFADYWGGAPDVKSVTFVAVPELSARVSGLIAGEFDIITELPPDQFRTITGAGSDVLGGSIANIRVIKYNTAHPSLRDPRIRQAMTLAIDRKAIVDAFWAGKVAIERGNQVPAFGDMYIGDYPLPEYNPAKARALLQAAGYNGAAIPYLTIDGYYIAELSTAQALKAMWEAVGLKIDLGVRESFAQINAETYAVRDGSEPVTFADPISSVWRAYGPASRGTVSAIGWQNQRFDALGGKLLVTLDLGERRRIFREMLDILAWDDPAGAVLHSFGMFYGAKPGLGWQPYPAAYMDFRRENMR